VTQKMANTRRMTNSVAKRLLRLSFLLFIGHISHILDRQAASKWACTNRDKGKIISYFVELSQFLALLNGPYSLPMRSAKVYNYLERTHLCVIWPLMWSVERSCGTLSLFQHLLLQNTRTSLCHSLRMPLLGKHVRHTTYLTYMLPCAETAHNEII
jgi:hypothetical protein